MGKTEIIKQLRQSFIDEDNREPFQNREYVGETLRIFDLLLGTFDDSENDTDNAIYDIVSDIFGYFGEDEFERLLRNKMKLIKMEKGVLD